MAFAAAAAQQNYSSPYEAPKCDEPTTTFDLCEGLQMFQQNVTKLRRFLGSGPIDRRGEHQLRRHLDALADLKSRLARGLENELRDPAPAGRARYNKLSKDYRLVNALYESAHRDASAKLAAMEEIHATERGGDGEEFRVARDQAIREADARMQAQMQEDAINEAILREREHEIEEIHQTVTQVNEVFKDLADIVADQQQEIDAVESMIERSHQHARSGLQQVEKANSAEAEGTCAIS